MVIMKNTTNEIRKIVGDYARKIDEIPDSEFHAKPLPHKWSKIEVLGHLIDSAENNLRRFICGQYESEPPFIIYDQDFWVRSNDYAHGEKKDILLHWKLVNDRICAVLDTMPQSHYTKSCRTSRSSTTPVTLEWLAGDYVKHMKHHLNQIIAGSFDVVYP
jgi:hypothetical protein